MGKILATTDFSSNSKAGLRFAIQLAAQNKSEVTFFHAYNIMSPTSWNAAKIEAYETSEEKKLQEKLDLFIAKIYKGLHLVQKHRNCIIQASVYPETAIKNYAAENNFDFICISTRGAGKVEKFLGTNTSNLINESQIPVIAVPDNYRIKKVTDILYASDLVHLEKELVKVVAFAKPLNSKVELLHFTSPAEPLADSKIIEVAVKEFSKYEVKLNIKNTDYVKTSWLPLSRPSRLQGPLC